jgi:hypothetical protein
LRPRALFRISLPRYTFALPFARPVLAAIPMFPACSLAFRTPARCSHDYSISACPLAVSHTPTPARISAARSLFPARPLAVSRTLTPACISTARSLFPARRSLFPARPFTALRARNFPRACSLPSTSSSASCFLFHLVLPLRLTGEAEPGAERDKNRL